MRNIFLVLLALFCLNLSGCGPYGSVRTPAEIAALDYGPYPEDYQEIVKYCMSRRLADPYSAHYEFQGSPTIKYKPVGLLYDEAWGWGGAVYVNAKNKYGAYEGVRSYDYIIHYGKVVLMKP